MRFILHFCLIFTITYPLVSEIDTNRIYKFQTIDITTERISKELEFSTIKTIQRADIEISNYFQINEILSKSPGIFIKNYGGLGGLKTISLRGTNSMQNVIAFDGIPLNSMQNGSYDLSGIPLYIIDKIEIIRGGSSSFYGSNAIAGAINLSPKINDTNIFRIYFKYSSFEEFQNSLNYDFKTSSLKNSINLDWTNSRGLYPIKFEQFGEKLTIKRKNNNYKNFNFNYNNEFETTNILLKNSLIVENSSRGVPGAVLQGHIESSKSKLDENKIFIKSSIDYSISNFSTLEIDGAYKYSFMKYNDPDLPSNNITKGENKYIANDFIFIIKYSLLCDENEINFKSGFNYSHLNGDMLDLNVGRKVKRLNPYFTINFYKSNDLNFGILQTNLALRSDFFDDGEPAHSPSLGIKYIYKNFSLKFLNSFNYRKPSFNEMYYFNFGNKNLKPEKSYNTNLSGCINFSPITIELTAFYIQTLDQIIAIPKSPITWSAVNLEKVLQSGLELTIEGHFNQLNIEKFIYNWTLQFAKNKTKNSLFFNKQIPLMPQELINGMVIFNLDYFKINFAFDYSSFRFIDAENNRNHLLPEYIIIDFGISHSIKTNLLKTELLFDVKNLLNKQYEIVPNYPMPGRQYILGLRLVH